MGVELTPVVDIMARAAVEQAAKAYGHEHPEKRWDELDPHQQRNIRQDMLDALLPALGELDRQVQSAVELELMRRENTT